MSVPINPNKRDWMKQQRKHKKLTTREISAMFGVSHQHYNDIENGRRNPSIELSVKMAEFFEMPLEVFLIDRTKFKREEN